MAAYFKVGMPVLYFNSKGTICEGAITNIADSSQGDYPITVHFGRQFTTFSSSGYEFRRYGSHGQGCIIPYYPTNAGDIGLLYNYYADPVECIVVNGADGTLAYSLRNEATNIPTVQDNATEIIAMLQHFWENYTADADPLVPYFVPLGDSKESKLQNIEKGYTMKKVIDANKASAITAAKITLGKNAIKTAQKAIAPKLPMWAKGYAQHPVSGIILANVFNYVVETKLPDNEKAKLVAGAMMDASMLMSAEHFDIEGIIQNFLDGLVIPKDVEVE